MQVRQYAYFALRSNQIPATAMTARLGIEPDETMVRASKRTEPPRPVSHAWEIVCRLPNMTVDEQIDHLLDRLEPSADRIGELATELDRIHGSPGSATLQVVRYFDASNPEQVEERNLLGWHLNSRVLDFLRRTHAELDVDEYRE